MKNDSRKKLIDPHGGDVRQDEELVRLALHGDRSALERLVERYQDRVYNLSLRMSGNPADAEDRTQEIMVKLITRLSSFKGNSRFGTWLYRIAVNHNLDVKKSAREKYFRSFEAHAKLRVRLADAAGPGSLAPAEEQALTEETKSACLSGMLLCLDRKERTVLLLGAIFNLESAAAALIMGTTAANFRQMLSRTRKRLAAYLSSQCGLFNPENDCRCGRKVTAALRMGIVGRRGNNPRPVSLGRVGDFVAANAALIDDALALRLRNIFRELPFYRSPAGDALVKRLLDRPEIKRIINFEAGAGHE